MYQILPKFYFSKILLLAHLKVISLWNICNTFVSVSHVWLFHHISSHNWLTRLHMRPNTHIVTLSYILSDTQLHSDTQLRSDTQLYTQWHSTTHTVTLNYMQWHSTHTQWHSTTHTVTLTYTHSDTPLHTHSDRGMPSYRWFSWWWQTWRWRARQCGSGGQSPWWRPSGGAPCPSESLAFY